LLLLKDEDEFDGQPMSTFGSVWEISRTAWLWLLAGCLASVILSFRTIVWTYLLGQIMMVNMLNNYIDLF